MVSDVLAEMLCSSDSSADSLKSFLQDSEYGSIYSERCEGLIDEPLSSLDFEKFSPSETILMLIALLSVIVVTAFGILIVTGNYP